MPKYDPKDIFGPIPEGAYMSEVSTRSERDFGFSSIVMMYFDGNYLGEHGKVPNYIAYMQQGEIKNGSKDDLYHYTNGIGFNGIVTTKELRASLLGSMNDHDEISYTRERFLTQVLSLLNDNNEIKNISKKLNSLFDKYICKSTYSISFSKRANLLSQWNRYSDKDGASIGFAKRLLLEACKHPDNWKMVEIEYDAVIHTSKLKSIAVHFLNKNILNLSDDQLEEWFCESSMSKLQICASCFKHPGFREEEEVRLIIELKSNESDSNKYVSLDLLELFNREQSLDFNFEYIFSGPSNDNETKMKDIYNCLLREKMKFLVIIDSGIPFVWQS